MLVLQSSQQHRRWQGSLPSLAGCQQVVAGCQAAPLSPAFPGNAEHRGLRTSRLGICH
jgi:hypothetical protein